MIKKEVVLGVVFVVAGCGAALGQDVRLSEAEVRVRVDALRAEVTGAFERSRERLLSQTSDPNLQRRLRAVQLNLDLFAREGVRAQKAEFFPRGSTVDLRDRPHRFRVDTLYVEIGNHLDRISTYGSPNPAEARALSARFSHIMEAELARGLSLRGALRAQSVERLLAPLRRADRTVDWKRAAREGTLRQASGLAHFGLALFLKELAVTIETGERARIEEFFDFLTTSDFYVTYGLFAAGARAGEVAYGRFLARHVRSSFVSGILRTNLALATGMALPELLRGDFDGRTFAIHLGSLGLSASAVKAGAEGLRWVTNLRQAERAGQLARAGARLRTLARGGGWFYTVAETAVVLYVGDKIAQAVSEHLDEQAARESLGEATLSFLGDALDPERGREDLAQALEDFSAAHADYRAFLYQRLARNDGTYAAQLSRSARSAKLLEDRRRALSERLRSLPALEARALEAHGSIEAYLDAQLEREEAALRDGLSGAMGDYEAARRRGLEEIYAEGRREGPYRLHLTEQVRWIAEGMPVGDRRDPFGERADVFTRHNREALRREAIQAAGSASPNRLQAYEDERSVLAQVREHLPTELRGLVDERVEALTRLQARERQLVSDLVPGILQRLRQAQ